ncbi:MAG: BON domain-containing protein [Gemmataceae bacterium]
MRIFVFVLIVPFILSLTGCGRQDKEVLANIGRKITSKFENATSPARKKLELGIQAMRGEFLESSLTEAVLFRIRTDKNLKDQKIEVFSKEEGVILLKGTVTDEPSKIRAYEVAENTKGVTKVESELIEKSPEDSNTKKTAEPKDVSDTKKNGSEVEKSPEKPKEQFQPFDPNKTNEKGEQDKPAPPIK